VAFPQAVEREKSRYNFAPTVTGNLPGSRAFQYCREIARSRPTSRLSNRAILACTQIVENHIISQWSVNYLSHCKGDKTSTLCYLKERVRFYMATEDKSPVDITRHYLSRLATIHCFVSFLWIRMFRNEFKMIFDQGPTMNAIISRQDNLALVILVL